MAEGYKDWSAGDILTAADLEDYTVKQSVMVFADASARTTALSSVLREGMVSYLKDTDSTEVYDGSAWTQLGATPGLTLIKKVTFSGVTSFSEDNVFTSTYDNYLILLSGSSTTTAEISLRLRVGGVDATGSNYVQQKLNVTSSTVAAVASTITEFDMVDGSTIRFDSSCEIFEPAVAVETGFESFGHRDGSRISLLGSEHNLTNAYDGFTVFIQSGNFTGALWLYGYDKD